MKIFIILFLFFISANSSIVISDDSSSFKDFEINLYKDKTKNLSIEEIKNIKQAEKISNNTSQGIQDANLWYHFSLKNETNKTQKRTFFITDPFLWNVKVFVLENKKVIDYIYSGSGVMKDGQTAKYSPELEITLKAKQTKEIYIRVYTPYHNIFNVSVYTKEDLIKHKILKTSLLYFYFGAIGALLLYNLFIFFSIRDNNYLLYTGFVLFYCISQLELYALYPFDNFSSVELAYKFSTSHVFWFAFHTLFSVKLLNIKEHYPRIDKYLMYSGYFLLFLSFVGFYDLTYPIQIMNVLMLILPFIILFIAIKLHLKNNKVAIYYIIAQTLFIFASTCFGLLFAGVIEYNIFTRYVNLVGSFSEIILFSFALAYKTRLIMQENQKQKELMDDYAKLSFIGQTMINISHQWKTPINAIYNSINHMEIAREFRDKDIEKIIDNNIKNIKQNTIYLKDTAFNQLNFYKEKKNIEEINIYDEIQYVINLIENEFSKKSIDITLICASDLNIKIEKNYFLNVLMILLENSFNIFEKRNVKNPAIKINIEKIKDKYQILFEDNAGGVSKELLPNIFDKNYSLENSTGVGLYLAKELIEHKLNGDIFAQNIQNGLLFKIQI